jgi:hypothetical protein
MKQITKKTIIGIAIFSMVFLTGGFFIKEAGAQSTSQDTAILNQIAQVLSVIAQRLSVFTVKDGKVGIGTDTPISMLDIQTAVNQNYPLLNVESNSTIQDGVIARFKRSAPYNAVIDIDSDGERQEISFKKSGTVDWQIGTEINNKFLFRNNEFITRMTIEQNGNVGIGITNPTHLLHVNGIARSNQASFATTSDIRLKDVNGDYKNGLNEILGINPVIFSYKKNNPLGLQSDKEFIGVVAQELQEIIPEAVEEAEDGYLTVNNDAVMWAMVNGMKEQQEQIKYLLEENKVLKEKVDYLMSR